MLPFLCHFKGKKNFNYGDREVSLNLEKSSILVFKMRVLEVHSVACKAEEICIE